MADKEICAICLIIDVRMIHITQELSKIYLDITGLKAKECNSMPRYVCSMCYTQMRKSHEFKKKCLRSQKLLNLIKSSNKEITKSTIKTLDRKALGLVSHLSYLDGQKASFSLVVSNSDAAIVKDPLKTEDEYLNDPLTLPEVYNSMLGKVAQETKLVIGSDNKMHVEVNPKDLKMDDESDATISCDDNVDSFSEDDSIFNETTNEDVKELIPESLIKTETNVETVKRDEYKKSAPVVKKEIVLSEKISKLFYVQRLTPQDQEIQLLNRKLSSTYTLKKYKCELCYTGFNSAMALKQHNHNHEYGVFGKYLCDVCKKYKATKKDMRKHIQGFHSLKFNCKTCGHTSYSLSCASFHHKKKHETITYACVICNQKFNNVHTFSMHKVNAHATVPCRLCGLCFVKKNGVVYHMKCKHGVKEQDAETLEVDKEDPLYCKVCQTLFADHNAYGWHLVKSSNHTNNEALEFAKDNESKISMKRFRNFGHKGRKSETRCQVCSMWLPSLHQAKKHYRKVHPGVAMLGDYICHICGRTFLHGYSLEKHFNVHSTENRFECPKCHKGLRYHSNLLRHMKTFHGEKDVLCNLCDYKTSLKWNLKIHIQEVHMNIPYVPKIRSEQRRIQKRRMEKMK